MKAAVVRTIRYTTGDGDEVTLGAEDCRNIINAMIRSRMLDVHVEALPEDAEEVWCDAGCAWSHDITGEGGGEEIVTISVDASDHHCCTPRTSRRKAKR